MQSNVLFHWSKVFSQWCNFTPRKPEASPGSNLINLAWDDRDPLTERQAELQQL